MTTVNAMRSVTDDVTKPTHKNIHTHSVTKGKAELAAQRERYKKNMSQPPVAAIEPGKKK